MPSDEMNTEWLTWLRALREMRGMRQDELAEASGMSAVAISKLERGLCSPRHATARKIAKALNVPVELVFPDEDEPSPAEVLSKHLGLPNVAAPTSPPCSGAC